MAYVFSQGSPRACPAALGLGLVRKRKLQVFIFHRDPQALAVSLIQVIRDATVPVGDDVVGKRSQDCFFAGLCKQKGEERYALLVLPPSSLLCRSINLMPPISYIYFRKWGAFVLNYSSGVIRG